MKWIYISLCFSLLSGCLNNENTKTCLFSDKLVNSWENTTLDTINEIFERYKDTKVDNFYLDLISGHRMRLYNHDARFHFVEDVKNDSSFLNAQIENCIVIEQSNEESEMLYRIIYSSNNENICLSYKLTHENDLKDKYFILYKKDTIDSKIMNKFIQEVRKSNLFKNESNNGEYYNGNIVISFISKNKVEVFPYLTFNFSNNIYKYYNEIIN